jgi:hypothetical protein
MNEKMFKEAIKKAKEANKKGDKELELRILWDLWEKLS